VKPKIRKNPKNPPKIKRLRRKIHENNGKIKLPDFDNKPFVKYNSNSFFDIKVSWQNNLHKIEPVNYDMIENDGYKTQRIKIYPNEEQKKILANWFDSYIRMYNETTNYFKKCRFDKVKPDFNITKLKKIMKNKKDTIKNGSELIINRNNKTKKIYADSHLLDYAINDSVNRYKACISNLKAGNIRHFRLRYLKLSKKNKIIKLEKLAFKDNGFCVNALGNEMKCAINGFNYINNIITTATLKHDLRTDEYFLLIKHLHDDVKNDPKYTMRNQTISIDPGLRTFLTGVSNNNITEIGTEKYLKKYIERKLKQIDSIAKNYRLSKEKRQIAMNKRYDKIKSKIKDLHWKTADYLTKRYKNIVIGNFSTKSMGESNKTNDMTKRIGSLMSIYKFKERLKYKCFVTGTNYKEIDEAYTSKCCCRCGYYKQDLGDNKTYNCNNCKQEIKRDINGAINILQLSL